MTPAMKKKFDNIGTQDIKEANEKRSSTDTTIAGEVNLTLGAG
jgi:hypothetical protein